MMVSIAGTSAGSMSRIWGFLMGMFASSGFLPADGKHEKASAGEAFCY
jgi:hypothetical protein